jgi:hypothetical protein
MRRVVIDTNLYSDWLNAGRHEALLFQRDAVKYLSAVVMPAKYDVKLDLRVARRPDLTIPPAALVRADEVIR